ncbi:ABC transporter permease [Streptomyces sparsogenes]|uniref:ABC transporter permease n=1 Tax=Streptomyces sparsogenes TaxID=67365 RepID=UPI0008259B70|nr:ABC transporter permease [Streptomyces sparsogenes]
MSKAGGGSAGAPARRPGPLWTLALFRSELGTTFRRWRTIALLGVLAAIPVLVGIAVKIETSDGGSFGQGRGGDGEGPAFFAQITNNGIFLVFASLAATLPVFLPMAIGVIAGDAVAGEAGSGTLRYLLVAPAGRTRLLLAKFTTVMAFCLVATLVVAAAGLATGALLFPLGDVTLISGTTVMAFCLVATLVVAAAGLATGALLFPLGDVTLISGTTVSFADGLLRALAVAGLVAYSLIGIATVGLFISTLTNSGIAAMAATVGLLVTVQILDTIPQLHAIQPYLFPHYWLSFADVLRDPVYWDQLAKNFGLQALYVAVFGSAAWARFTAKDITV